MQIWYPKAIRKPLSAPAHSDRKGTKIIGFVPHVQVGHNSLQRYFSDLRNEASSHLWVSYKGVLEQYVTFDRAAWTQSAGNRAWVTCECEGYPNEPYTNEQLDVLAEFFAWGSKEFSWPLQITNNSSTGGLGTHVMGGISWGGHSCFPLDTTEVLTPNGWKWLIDIDHDDEVASWSADSGSISFDRVLGVTPLKVDSTVVIEYRGRLGFEMTSDHTVYWRRQGNTSYKTTRADQLTKSAYIPLAGSLAERKGLSVTNDILRLLVHIQADGHYMRDAGMTRPYGIEFHYSKQRKIQRTINLLDRLSITYSKTMQTDGTTKIRIYGSDTWQILTTHLSPDKTFTWEWLNLTEKQFAIFHEELMLADGCYSQQVYRSSDETNLDIVQAIYHLNGRKAARDKHGTGLYMTNVKMRTPVNEHAHMYFERSSVRHGRNRAQVGCVTTVNGTVLIRQNKQVAIFGNCPGTIRSGQRLEILRRALRTGIPSVEHMKGPDPKMSLTEEDKKFLQSELFRLPIVHATWKYPAPSQDVIEPETVHDVLKYLMDKLAAIETKLTQLIENNVDQ